ncbi:hypothetical protein [Actinacidiphila acidipaludis]|uniref:Uncharacterized protein n=1 Tax=Actinacidiphila acidipaludis TaxID=2873382 RepID=A0ABS7Q1L8_9ACTN|nr:hypothetical protein [Streptomyces acidipaludis]MBY8876345.1 hypothetical protein [Streptomyces acidipaludis]
MNYEFRIAGAMPDALAGAFPELHRRPAVAETLLSGPVVDTAHLYALLLRFEDLGLRVIEMRSIPEYV